jgi:hypothetical protein
MQHQRLGCDFFFQKGIWLEDSYDGGRYPYLLLIRTQKRESDGKWEYKDIVFREKSSELK